MKSHNPNQGPDGPRWRLVIDRNWGGHRLPAEEWQSIELDLTESSLRLSVEGRYFRDPRPVTPVGPTDGLWEFEVVELFLAERFPDGPVRYVEIECSPHGHWLAWGFVGVRRRCGDDLPLAYQAAIEGDRWRATAELPLDALPKPPWALLGCALREGDRSRRHNVSATLPGGVPDFHQPLAYRPAEDMRSVRRRLLAPYRSTTYRVEAQNDSIDILIGETTPALDSLLVAQGHTDWAFLTACNPGSQALDAISNSARQDQLLQEIKRRSWTFFEGVGVPADDAWVTEPSFLIAGIQPHAALEIARSFSQNALIIGSAGEPAELVWTTP